MPHYNLVIRVRSTGSNNTARVLGYGHTASSTCSPLVAVERAAKKFFGDAPVKIEEQKRFIGTPWVKQFTASGETP